MATFHGQLTNSSLGLCISVASSQQPVPVVDLKMFLHRSSETEASAWLAIPNAPSESSLSAGAVTAIVLLVMVLVSAIIAVTYVYAQKHCAVRLQYSARRFFDSTSVLVDDEREQNYLFAL